MVIRGIYTAIFVVIFSIFGIYLYRNRTFFSQICPPKCPPNEYISFYMLENLSP